MIGRTLVATIAAMLAALAVTAPVAPAQGLLGRGSAGPEVREWQQQLNLDAVPGADIAVDGIFGPQTESKTERFQEWRDITVDGIVGPETRAAMRQAFRDDTRAETSAADRPLLGRGNTGAAVETWQDRLNDWLATARPEQGQLREDGIFGPRTEAATRDFQGAADIAVDGIVGPETRAALDAET